MHSISVWGSAAGRVGLVLLLVFTVSGCQEKPMAGNRKTKPVPCDTTIVVDPSNGAYPLAAFVCEDDTVTWDGKGHKFQVQFNAGSPFVGAQTTTFDDQHPSGKVKNKYDRLEIYKYTITVDTTHVFDPQVVGGGNP